MTARWLAAFLMVVGLVAADRAWAADWRAFLSPGVLMRGHDDFAGDCDQCHLVFDGVPDAKCLSCHEVLADRISDQRGFHAKHGGEACSSCHPDHRGLAFSGTSPEALAAFDHKETGFPIAGSHASLKCDECHTAPIGKMADSCDDCHDDAHQSALGPDCAPCHTDTKWSDQLKSLADHHTATDGGHQGLGCDDCHLHGEHLEPSVACATCHPEAHDGTTSNCDECHTVAGWTPAKFDHGPCTCAFPGKHQTVECLACHEGFDFTDTPTLCAGCHEKDRKHEPLGECGRCHNALSWTDNQFDHDKTKFPLKGEHLAVACNQCHTTAGVFRGLTGTCATCHAEAGLTAHGDFGPCEKCHTPAGFAPSSFDHASVGFPLTGRHAEAPCQDCHATKVQGYPN
ncbi:MAG: hypothetical protein ABMB14_03095 [Myxococcota bacterium]